MQDIMQFVSNHTLLSMAWLALFVVVVVTTVKGRLSPIRVMTRTEATRLINQDNAILVDIRTQDEFRKGHIANAINVLAADIAADKLDVLAAYKNKNIIVVCTSGMDARKSAEKLAKSGFETVAVLKDGISGWSGEKLPLVQGK